MTTVRIYKYDLTNGMAAQLSPMFLGFQVEAIWHTSVCAYGKEFYFDGGIGISEEQPGSTRFGRPLRTTEVGTTNKTEEQFRAFVASKNRNGEFGPNDYHLLEKNCNNFTSAAVRFLFDDAKDLDEDVKGMIPRLLASPMGQMLAPMIQNFTTSHHGQTQQQQFQGLQQQFQQQNIAGGAAAAASASESSSTSVKQIDEDSWEKLVQEVESKPASESLSSFLWVEGSILNDNNVVSTSAPPSNRREVYPAQSGTNKTELDERILSCLGFSKSSSSSWKFYGDGDVLETAKMLASSLVGDLEVRWSKETTATTA